MLVLGLLSIFLPLSGCSLLGSGSSRDDGLAAAVLSVPLDSVPQSRTDCGNEPSYTINDKTYQVLPTAAGYQEQGVASWYGAEYQGSRTAGCEIFDMHAFTAAHRTLPLPSFVRVTNLKNGKSVIVRVNDRGPFENNSLIQLSFAAASTLGMTQGSRVAQVRLEAVEGDQQTDVPPTVSRPRPDGALSHPLAKKPNPAEAAAIARAKQAGKSFFVVVKNYPDQVDALEMFVRLTSVGLNKTELASAVAGGRVVHQVRIGPLYTQDQIDNVRDALESNGLATYKVVEVGQ